MHDFGADGSYFLGNIVLSRSSNSKALIVIDGQQRLITISLLLRSLYERHKTHKKLKATLYKFNDWSEGGDGPNELRLMSEVNGGRENKSINIILQENNEDCLNSEEDNFSINYKFFLEKIDKLDIDHYQSLTDNLLNSVVLLPIECGDDKQALKIFETINNRGLSLEDSDIFKSLLYRSAQNDGKEKEFMYIWENLEQDVESFSYNNKDITVKGNFLTYLFRCYMYLLKSQRKDTSKAINLRDFFEGYYLDNSGKKGKKCNKNEYKLINMKWEKVLSDLRRILDSWECIQSSNGRIRLWWAVIRSFRNDDPFYPSLILIIRYLYYDEDAGECYIPNNNMELCIETLQNIVRCYWRAKMRSPGMDIRHTMLTIASDIWHNEYYKQKKFWCVLDDMDKLKNNLVPKDRMVLLLILTALQYKKQKYIDNISIEHIVPKKWEDNYYDQWDKEKVEETQNHIGNLVLLEKKLNFKGGNKFFKKKREIYQKSEMLDAHSVSQNSQWTYATYEKRHNDSLKILKDFFEKEV